MAGKFPFMIFGLPAAAYAIYRCAKPEKRQVAGLRIFIGMLIKVAARDAAQAFLDLFGEQRLIAEVRDIHEHDLAGNRLLIGEDLAVAFDDHNLPLDFLLFVCYALFFLCFPFVFSIISL